MMVGGKRPPTPALSASGAWEGAGGRAWGPLLLPTHRDLVRLPAAVCAHSCIGRESSLFLPSFFHDEVQGPRALSFLTASSSGILGGTLPTKILGCSLDGCKVQKAMTCGCRQRSQASSVHQATVCRAPLLAYECLSQLSWQWPRRSQGLPTPPASWLPEAAATQAPGISAGPQAARLSPVAPRIHSRTSMALCLLAILPAFTLSLPKNDRGEAGS